MTDLDDIHAETIEVYERNAEGWDKRRSRSLLEKPWLDKIIQPLAPGSPILDVGCGAGEPIAGYLIERGFSVTGVDSSSKMIAICKSRFPDESWIAMDMRELNLEKRFAAIVAWDSFFHLKQDEQRSALKRFIQHLCPQGRLLLTVGHEAGEVIGSVEGEEVYHSSLSSEDYKQTLLAAGLQEVEIVLQDESCGSRTVLLAR